MGKLIEKTNLKRSMSDKIVPKKLFDILSHKRNANQNNTDNSSNPSKDCNYQEKATTTNPKEDGKDGSHIVIGNVN
jgi:hypothetical protein